MSMNPSAGEHALRMMEEQSVGFFMEFLHRVGAHQMLGVSLTYVVTSVHRNSKDCTLYLLTSFPWVGLSSSSSPPKIGVIPVPSPIKRKSCFLMVIAVSGLISPQFWG